MLQSLDLSQSTLQGSLPPEWGQPQAFPSLKIVNASFTQLTGPLPSAWGSPDAFLKLTNLSLVRTDITGGLPDSWATQGAWPQLVALQVDQTHISGQSSPLLHLSHLLYLSCSIPPTVLRRTTPMPTSFVFAQPQRTLLHRTANKAQLQWLQANACGVVIRALLVTLHLDCMLLMFIVTTDALRL